MSTSRKDYVNTIEFLRQLRPEGPFVLTAIVPDGPIETFVILHDEGINEFACRYDGTRNCYYSINPVRAAYIERALNDGGRASKASKADIAAIEYALSDLDPRHDESPDAAKQRYQAALAAHGQPPTFLVDSGNGLQAAWRLKTQVLLAPPLVGTDGKPIFDTATLQLITEHEAVSAGLMRHFGGAPGTQNIDRILRLPGTTNLPNRSKREAGRVACETKLLYFDGASYDKLDVPLEPDAPAADGQTPPPTPGRGATAKHPLPRQLATMLFIPNGGAKQPHGPYADRSDLLFAFITGCLRAGVTHRIIAAACSDAAHAGHAIYQHCQENGGGRYVVRQLHNAKKKIDEDAAAVAPSRIKHPRRSLAEVRDVFKKWFGDEYDTDALDATLATAAAEQLTGNPPWLLLISGPGAAETETVQALLGSGAHITSTIASEGALLSASPKRSRSKQATGGLLRKIGARGVLVIKDVTTILSMARETRSGVLAALREIHDGKWERNVGSDGGQSLRWEGRLVVIGAVTTAWDAAHAVVSVMGDRFVLVGIDSTKGRMQSGRRAIRNTGSEVAMRNEMAAAVGGLLDYIDTREVCITDVELEQLLKAANLVTNARTAVERDYQGNVVNSHDPEMPTRFAKQLTQVMRGGIAIGMERTAAMRLALRCARDSIPPLRLAILLDVNTYGNVQVSDTRKRIGKPWSTVKREMEGLTMLGMLECDEEPVESVAEGDTADATAAPRRTIWRYNLSPHVDAETLTSMAPEGSTALPLPELPF